MEKEIVYYSDNPSDGIPWDMDDEPWLRLEGFNIYPGKCSLSQEKSTDDGTAYENSLVWQNRKDLFQFRLDILDESTEDEIYVTFKVNVMDFDTVHYSDDAISWLMKLVICVLFDEIEAGEGQDAYRNMKENVLMSVPYPEKQRRMKSRYM